MKISSQNISTDILRQNILEKANETFQEIMLKHFQKRLMTPLIVAKVKTKQITKDYELGKETDLTRKICNNFNIAFQMTLNVEILSSTKI